MVHEVTLNDIDGREITLAARVDKIFRFTNMRHNLELYKNGRFTIEDTSVPGTVVHGLTLPVAGRGRGRAVAEPEDEQYQPYVRKNHIPDEPM